MRKIIISLLALFSLCSCAKQESVSLFENKEELDIIVATDLHYYSSELFKECSWFEEAWQYEDGQMIYNTHHIVDEFISEVLQQQPDLVMISGDLTYNGEKVSHEELVKQLSRLTDANIKVAVINGNHDINNIMSLAFNEEGSYKVDNINVEDYKNYYSNFGLNQAYSIDKKSLSYALDLNDRYNLIVIDSCRDDISLTSSNIEKGTMKWIEKQLKNTKKQNKKALVMMHHNIGIHCEAIYDGYVLNNAQEMQDLFTKYNVPVVFSGHSHIQHTKTINNTTEIVTSALSIAPVQYGQITLTNDTLHYQTKEVEAIVGDEDFFKLTSFNKLFENMQYQFDQETAKQLANYFAEVNLSYFSGDTFQNLDQYTQDSCLELLEDNSDFHNQYLECILSENMNHQKITIEIK